MKSSWDEWGIEFLKDEALSMSLRIDSYLLKEGARRIIFKIDWRDGFFLAECIADENDELGLLTSSWGK